MRIPFKNGWERCSLYAAVALALAFALAALPLLAYFAAHNQILAYGRDVALGYAQNVLERSERISDALKRDTQELNAVGGSDPCSAAHLDLMRDLALQSIDFMIIGHVSGNILRCSSYGPHPEGIDVGPPSYVGQYNVRRHVRLSATSRGDFLTVEDRGWIFFFSSDQPIDVPRRGVVSLATYSPMAREFRTHTGFLKPQWMNAGRAGEETTFTDGSYVVAVLESKRYPTGVIAALPISRFSSLETLTESLAVAIALFIGLLLSALTLYLARKRTTVSSWTLRRALKGGEIHMVYQPIVDLKTGAWVGAEALMRWRRAQGVEIPPDIFIAKAESLGMIGEFTQRMLALVAQDARGIFARAGQFYLSINLAADDVKSDRIIADLRTLLADSGGNPQQFKVEVTERSILDESLGRDALDAIRALGMRVVVDDFGTGGANLKYLTTFTFDDLKIDKVFVQGIGTNAVTAEVAFHIVRIAKSLNMGLIAEGVETDVQAESLRQAGVESAQGWLYSRPRTTAALIDALPETTVGPTGSAAPRP